MHLSMLPWGEAKGDRELEAQEIKVAIIIDLRAQIENWPFNLEAKDEQATLTIPFRVLRL